MFSPETGRWKFARRRFSVRTRQAEARCLFESEVILALLIWRAEFHIPTISAATSVPVEMDGCLVQTNMHVMVSSTNTTTPKFSGTSLKKAPNKGHCSTCLLTRDTYKHDSLLIDISIIKLHPLNSNTLNSFSSSVVFQIMALSVCSRT